MRYTLFLILFLPFLVKAQSKPYTVESIPNQKLINNSYVSNPDTILNTSSVFQIDTLLSSLENKTSVQVAVVAVKSIGEEDLFEFAQNLFTTWGIGNKEKDNGLLVLLVKDKHEIRFHTGSGVEGVLPDITCKRIQRDYMVPEFKNNDYDAGMLSGLQQVSKILTDPSYAEELMKPEENESSSYTGFVSFLSFFAAPFLLIYFVIKTIGGKFSDSINAKATPYPEMRMKKWNWAIEFIGIPVLIVILSGISPIEDPAVLCFFTLYFYYLATQLHKLWLMKKVITRFLSEHKYYEIVEFLRKDQFYWLGMGIVFPLPFLLYFFYHLKRKRSYRNHPRTCTLCMGKMHKQSEQTEDQFLSKEQQMEETLRSINYDVWQCESCKATEEWLYPNRWSKYVNCPKCNTKAYYLVGKTTLVSASYSSKGKGEQINSCKFCGHTKRSTYSIPKLVASSSSSGGSSSGSSSSSGGSWGGGSSSGGGASSSW